MRHTHTLTRTNIPKAGRQYSLLVRSGADNFLLQAALTDKRDEQLWLEAPPKK